MPTPDDASPTSPPDPSVPVVVVPTPHAQTSTGGVPAATQLGLIEQFKAFWLALMDPGTSKLSKVAVGVAALYILSPVDLLPEALLAVFGLVDDMAALGFLAHAVATLPTEAHRRAVVAKRTGGADPVPVGTTRNDAPASVLPALIVPGRPTARRGILPAPVPEATAPGSLTQPFTTAVSALARGLALFGMGMAALALVLSIAVAWFFFSRVRDAAPDAASSQPLAPQVDATTVPSEPAVAVPPTAVPSVTTAPTAAPDAPSVTTPAEPETATPAAAPATAPAVLTTTAPKTDTTSAKPRRKSTPTTSDGAGVDAPGR